MSGKKRRSNQGITLISLLCLTVILVAGYLLYSNQKHKKEVEEAVAEKETEDSSSIINEEDEAQYASLQIQSSVVKEPINLVKTDDQWTLKEDSEYPLDKDKVGKMIDNLAKLSVSKTVVESAADLSEFGLSEPSVVITVKRQDGSELKVNIGDKLNINTDHYVSIDDKKSVYVLPYSISKQFIIDKEDLFYIPEKLSLAKEQIREIQLNTKSQGNFHLIYDENNPYDYTGLQKFKWYSTADSHKPVNVDNASVETVLDKYLSFSIEKGVAYGKDALKTYGLDDPAGTIYLRYVEADDSSKEHELTLHIGNKDEYGNYYVSCNDDAVVYFMAANQLDDKIAFTEDDVINPCINLINISYVSHLQITTATVDNSYDIEATDSKDSSDVNFKKNGVDIQDKSAFRKFYTKIISVNRSGFLTGNETVSQAPVLTVRFTFTSGKELEVSYYDYDEKNYAVTMNGIMQFTAAKKDVDELIKSL